MGVTPNDGARALHVVETQSLHDGEPMHWWEWRERGAPDRSYPDGGDRREPRKTINRNITGLSDTEIDQ